MKDYEKPAVIEVEGCAEGVYMTSGDTAGSDCYTAWGDIHQRPEVGRGDYRIQLNGKHAATDNHESHVQHFIVTFNQPVTYKSSSGELASGDGTSVLDIKYEYFNNPSDNIGLGDLCVESDAGLSIVGVVLTCDGYKGNK